ncbi:2-amino-4-hydroxy-6-hydroxymethyldihydropteridine diphosphokinase [Chloroflexota bacterium]
METVYLGLGSNLGDRAGNLSKAVALLGQGTTIEKLSSLYETEPIGYEDQPHFINAALQAATTLSPIELLNFLKRIEAGMGRVPSFPNAPRPIDIDTLLYGDRIIETTTLIIPHAALAKRAFVLVPLAEIAPGLIHPVLGKTVDELLAEATGREGVRRISACIAFPYGSTSTQHTP